MDGLVTGYDLQSKTYRIRSYFNAPDGIDGNITLTSEKKLITAMSSKLKSSLLLFYDLYAELIEDN
jgi:hypothetical protein